MPKDGALISIIVISHNRPALLTRALESIFSQSYRPIEIVLVDNQSDPPVAAPTPPAGITINLCKTPSYTNASISRNFGVANSSGQLIGFLDDDDYYLPGNITRQMAILRAEPDIDIVYMNTATYGPDGRARMVLTGTPDSPIMKFVHLNALVVRRHVAMEEPFHESLTRDIDDHFVIRIFARYKCRHIDEIGAVWMNDLRADQITYYTYDITAKFENLAQNYLNSKIMCEEFAEKFDQQITLRKAYYGRHSIKALLRFKPIEALRYGLASIGLLNGPRKKSEPER